MSRLLGKLTPFLGLAFFGLALWVLHRELANLRLHDVTQQLHHLPLASLGAALALTVLSYLTLTGYDTLSLLFMRRQLGLGRSALASFLSYAISQNIGLTLVSGAPIRFRLYSAWGLSAVEVATLVAFNGLTFWLGLLTVGGLAFAVGGGGVPAALHLPFGSLRPLGMLFLALVVGYVVACLRLRRPLRLGRWELQLPPLHLGLAQLLVSSADWTLSASVLWVLLPAQAQVGFLHFLSVFLLAQLVGLVSQVPGGIGVFESVVLTLLPAGVDSSVVIGSLLAYRAIYYLLPLVVATGMLLVYELRAQRQQVALVSGIIGSALSLVAPPLLSLTTFLSGVLLLLSGVRPAVTGRLRWLGELLSLPALEISHFLGSIVGVLLLLLAWGLRRRLRSAYLMTLGLLVAGALLSLIKAAAYEEALVIASIAAALAPAGKLFYRKAPLLSEPLSPRWLAAVAMVLVGICWIGFFAYRHVDYSSELWWQFTLNGDASRFLRGGVGIAVGLLTLGALRLLGPTTPRRHTPPATDLEQVHAIVSASSRASANLALLGDKQFLLSPSARSLVMYAVQGRSWVAMGDPVGPQAEHAELIWEFHASSDRHGGWTVFYEVGTDNLALYLDLGLTALKIGESASVPLETFSLEGRARKELRYVSRRLEREGCVFEVHEPAVVTSLLPELRRVSAAWLEAKHSREKGFSLGRFEEHYLCQLWLAVIRQHGRVVAFANLWHGASGGELSLDLMRQEPTAPSGVMDFLLVNLMLWGRDHGFGSFDLGMAPLAGLQTGPFATLWNRLASLAYRYGEHYYNFQGLRQFKEKFGPTWHPRFLACPGGRAVPGVLTDLATLISGGLLGTIRK